MTIGIDAARSGNNTHLLVIMRMRLSKKIGLIDLMNWTRLKKINGQKIRTESVHDYWGMYLMLHMQYIYYGHKNIEILGVCYWVCVACDNFGCHLQHYEAVYYLICDVF